MAPPGIVILVQENPYQTHRAAEGVRIALGLSTGPNPLTLILTNQARLILTEEAPETIDGEILEKHLPVIKDLEIPIVVPVDTRSHFSIDPDFSIQEASTSEIAALLSNADRVLVF